MKRSIRAVTTPKAFASRRAAVPAARARHRGKRRAAQLQRTFLLHPKLRPSPMIHHKRLMIRARESSFRLGSRNQQAGSLRSPDPGFYADCKQATLQTSSRDDSRVWGGIGYSRSVATGGSAGVATGKRSSSAKATVGQVWWCRRRQDRARLTSSSCFIRT